jgi:hypothetical protein
MNTFTSEKLAIDRPKVVSDDDRTPDAIERFAAAYRKVAMHAAG